jgi:hypothetical protein
MFVGSEHHRAVTVTICSCFLSTTTIPTPPDVGPLEIRGITTGVGRAKALLLVLPRGCTFVCRMRVCPLGEEGTEAPSPREEGKQICLAAEPCTSFPLGWTLKSQQGAPSQEIPV